MTTRWNIKGHAPWRWGCAALLAAGIVTAVHAQKIQAGTLAYLFTTSTEQEDSVASWGFNALDGKPGTAWCSGPDGVGQKMVVGFARQERITHVGVVVGAVKAGKLDKTHARVRELELTDGQEKRSLILRDDVEQQETQLEPPMNVRQLVITVKDIHAGADAHSPVCLAELSFRDGTTPLTGEVVVKQLKGLSKPRLRVAGPWLDEPSAPERYLTLSLDGSFSWRHEPLMEGERSSLHGTWDVSGSKLVLKPRTGKPITLRVALNRVEGRGGSFSQLELTGKDAPDKLPGLYRPASAP